MSFTIIDRRPNPGGKNLGNRQRFIKKAKEQITKEIKKGVLDRSIKSSDGQVVHVTSDGISEPEFKIKPGSGKTDSVLPGNKEFVPGDLINKPRGGSGPGDPNKASNTGDGEDDFEFTVSKDEFFEILFEGLELPNLVKKDLKNTETTMRCRSGYTSMGNPATLDLEQSMVRSIARRIALKNPKKRKLDELEAALLLLKEDPIVNQEEILLIEEEIRVLKRKIRAVTFLDPIDLRFKNFERRPKPSTQAVMVCVMDVSGSMQEFEKDLAKRFYMLLYLFLSYKYKKVDVVFIRHHTEAMECNEDDFFYLKESGGTVASTGVQLAAKIIKERYNPESWNIYMAQASDGDNADNDVAPFVEILAKDILPVLQYYSYIQVGSEVRFGFTGTTTTNLWQAIEPLKKQFDNISMKQIHDPESVYKIFRELFQKNGKKT